MRKCFSFARHWSITDSKAPGISIIFNTHIPGPSREESLTFIRALVIDWLYFVKLVSEGLFKLCILLEQALGLLVREARAAAEGPQERLLMLPDDFAQHALCFYSLVCSRRHTHDALAVAGLAGPDTEGFVRAGAARGR
jgi:hypothetical protein